MDNGSGQQQSVYLYLLERIEKQQAEGFHSVEAKLATKADKADISRLESRITEHDARLAEHTTRIDQVESEQSKEKTMSDVRRDTRTKIHRALYVAWVILTTLAIIAATAGLLH